jgi:hypothetical protein
VISLDWLPLRVAGRNLGHSLWLHPSTERAGEPDDGGEPYQPAAHLPLRKRRLLTASELAGVSAEWHWPSSHCISTFQIEQSAVEAIRRAAAAYRSDRIPTSRRHEEGEQLWALLRAGSPLNSVGALTWLGVSERPSGLRASTFDVATGCRLGLHVDGWDGTPLRQRHLARVRLCVNLGHRNRSFLFLPYDVATVVDYLESNGGIGDGTNIGARFCADFPDVPVFELVIPPGCAYLAPTDNLIHDGCSEVSDEPDVTAAWLGRIGYSDRLA